MKANPTIRAVAAADVPELLAFVLQARAELFPKRSEERRVGKECPV